MATAARFVADAPKAATNVYKSFRELHGVVVSAGLMQRTVKVRVGGMKWNRFLKKSFDNSQTYMVHDPNDSLRTGDVVAITPGERNSKHKRHVVKHIIAPAGTPIEERPPVPTEQERWAALTAKAETKQQRRALRQHAEQVERQLDYTARLAKKSMKQINTLLRLHGQQPVKNL
ncbi:hypothetical protein V8F06_003050 [Rhypophila decipiens]